MRKGTASLLEPQRVNQPERSQPKHLNWNLVVEPGVPEGLAFGGNQEVRPVAPSLQEPSEVLTAQFVPLVFVQFSPLPVLVTDQGQIAVGDDAVAFVFELEAVIDVQVPVKAGSIPA